jgi:hypothetical protein
MARNTPARKPTTRPVPGTDHSGRRPIAPDATSWDNPDTPVDKSGAGKQKRLNVDIDASDHKALRVWTATHDTDLSTIIRHVVAVIIGTNPADDDLRQRLTQGLTDS